MLFPWSAACNKQSPSHSGLPIIQRLLDHGSTTKQRANALLASGRAMIPCFWGMRILGKHTYFSCSELVLPSTQPDRQQNAAAESGLLLGFEGTMCRNGRFFSVAVHRLDCCFLSPRLGCCRKCSACELPGVLQCRSWVTMYSPVFPRYFSFYFAAYLCTGAPKVGQVSFCMRCVLT